jgi:hypothetical protein
VGEAGIFAFGVAVTLLVAAALALLIYGAVVDGRTEREVRARGAVPPPPPAAVAPALAGPERHAPRAPLPGDRLPVA